MPLSRSEQEAREARDLAPYAMPAAASRGRAHGSGQDPRRTAFQRDRDRIVHSRAFRRLAYKTQVFPNDEGDLYRSRLTHTMEVAQLARSAALQLHLNEDLVECIALAHDLGHPPFGHRGEDLLADLMAEAGGFSHHRQALRIVEMIEHRYADHPGLDLSYEVRESLAKLGIFDGAGIDTRFRPEEGALLEAQLVDAIDSMAYTCHDIDDGLRSGLIAVEQLQELALWQGAWRQAVDASPRDTAPRLLADRSIRILVDAFLGDLIGHSEHLLAELSPADLPAIRGQRRALIATSPSMAAARQELADWLFRNLYRHWSVNRRFHRARRVLAELFAFFRHHLDALPPEYQALTRSQGEERAVCDYIAGMTDRYAMEEWKRVV